MIVAVMINKSAYSGIRPSVVTRCSQAC